MRKLGTVDKRFDCDAQGPKFEPSQRWSFNVSRLNKRQNCPFLCPSQRLEASRGVYFSSSNSNSVSECHLLKRRYKSIGSTTRPKAICSQTASQAKIYQSKQSTIKSIKADIYGALWSFTEPYGDLRSLTNPQGALRSLMESYWALRSLKEPYRALRSLAEPYRVWWMFRNPKRAYSYLDPDL